MAYLKGNRRIVSPEIWSGSNTRYGPRTEFNLHYDFESLTARGVSPYTYYVALQSPLFDANVRQIAADDGLVTVRLASSAKDERGGWFYQEKEKYVALILLVVALIFVLTDFTFDKGGFAAFVMLCGITVNAGIYLLSAWRCSSTFRSSSCAARRRSPRSRRETDRGSWIQTRNRVRACPAA